MNELYTALFNAQYELEGVFKSSDNPFFKSKYADLTALLATIRPVWKKHGIGFTQFPISDEFGVGVKTIIFHHETGQSLEDVFTLPLAKRDPQAAGSAITYARRYALQSISGVPAIDDDAEAAMLRVEPTINQDQIAVIKDLLNIHKLSESDFCKKVRIKSIESLEAKRYDGAVKYLTELKND